jgi:HEAT repeat protein
VTIAGVWIHHLRASRDPVHLLKHGTYFERIQATADLGVLKEGADVDCALGALVSATRDGEIVMRSAAEESLGVFTAQLLTRSGRGTPADRQQTERRVSLAIKTLTQGLSDPDPTIRASAALGLGQIGKKGGVDLPPELAAALADESPIVHQAATKALNESQLTASVVPPLIMALASPEPEARFRATEILARVGPAARPAVPALLALLSEPFDVKRSTTDHTSPNYWDPACGAAIALGQIGPTPETIAGLTTMLASDVPERTSSAASGLAKLGPAAGPTVPALIRAYDRVLKSEKPFLGQSAIALALGRLGPHSEAPADSIAILTRGLDSKQTWVRLGAAAALGNFGRDAAAAIPKLRELEQSPDRDLQNAAKKALAAIEADSATAAEVSPPPQRTRASPSE